MKTNLLYFLLPNKAHINQYERRRIIVIFAILVISVSVLTLMGLLNIYRYGHTFIGTIELITALCSLLGIIDYKLFHNEKRMGFISVSIIFIFFLTFAYLNQNRSLGIIWTMFFPILAITVSGYKKGVIFSLLYFVFLFALAYDGIGVWQESNWDEISIIRLITASFVLTYIFAINEYAQFEANQLILEKEEREKEYILQLENLSIIDPLTTLYNRRKIDEVLAQELIRAHRYNHPISLTIFDIDDFKKVNDTYGHIVGDKVLIELSNLVKETIRKSDFFGRWGGEEFIIIYPETNLEQAKIITEKLREEIATHDFKQVGHVTCSFGLTQSDGNDTITTIVNSADKGLYEAKASGKNCTKVFFQNS